MPTLEAVDIVQRLFEFKGLYWDTLFESLDGFSINKVAGNVNLRGAELEILSGAVIDDYTEVSKEPIQHLTPLPIDWTKIMMFETKIEIPFYSQQVAYAMVGSGLALVGFGFKVVNNDFYGVVADGAAETLTASLAHPKGGGWGTKLKAVFKPSQADFYIDDAYKASLTTGLPNAATPFQPILSLMIQSKAAAARELFAAYWRYLCKE